MNSAVGAVERCSRGLKSDAVPEAARPSRGRRDDAAAAALLPMPEASTAAETTEEAAEEIVGVHRPETVVP